MNIPSEYSHNDSSSWTKVSSIDFSVPVAWYHAQHFVAIEFDLDPVGLFWRTVCSDAGNLPTSVGAFSANSFSSRADFLRRFLHLHSGVCVLPRVSLDVVMPVRGCRRCRVAHHWRGIERWRSHGR